MADAQDDVTANRPGAIPGRLGPYVLGDLLGRGGMGEVYRARDERLGRDVALKVMLTAQGVDALAVKRFLREVKVQASLSHPNLVRVLDVGEEAGHHYFAMELVSGTTLKTLVETSGALPVARVIAMGLDLAHALVELHARKIIHRDIKPQNVFLRLDGQAVLMDLGLVKLAGATVITEAGALLGTPRYLPPESLRADPADARCDIYQLGLVLYEAAVGRPAFPQDEWRTLAAGVVAGRFDPPAAVRPSIGRELDAFIRTLMATDPARRPPDATAVARALERIETGDPPLLAPAAAGQGPARERSRPVIARSTRPAASSVTPGGHARAVVGLVAMAAIAGLGLRLWPAHRELPVTPEVPRSSLVPDESLPATATPIGSPRDAGSSPAPSTSPSPGTFTGGWRPYRAMLPRLRAEGEVARRAVAFLHAQSLPIDFGNVPSRWAGWIALNEWLSDPVGPPPSDGINGQTVPVSLLKQDDLATAYALRHDLRLEVTVDGVRTAFAFVLMEPNDPRGWLVLGRLMEIDGREKEARIAFKRALDLPAAQQFQGHTSVVWDALVRALYALGGAERVRNELLAHIGAEPEPDDVWIGLHTASDALKLDRAVAEEILMRAKDDPRLGASAALPLGTLLLERPPDRRDPDAALSIWNRALARSPGDVQLHRRLAEFYLARGDAAAARTHADVLPADDDARTWFRLVTARHVTSTRIDGEPVPKNLSPALDLLLAIRWMEVEDDAAVGPLLAAHAAGEFGREGATMVVDELEAHGIGRPWSHALDETWMAGDSEYWMPCVKQADALDAPQGDERMRDFLDRVERRWPRDLPNFRLLEAQWHSRRGGDAQAMAILSGVLGDEAAHLRFLPIESPSRLLWSRAMGKAVPDGLVDTAMHLKLTCDQPVVREYWHALQAGDFTQATRAADRLFWVEPETPLWSLVAVWNAVRLHDATLLAASLERGRIACRHHRACVWPLREMAAIERRFGGR